MTDTPSIPAQIEAVRKRISAIESMFVGYVIPIDAEAIGNEAAALRAALVTLQQHERLEAAVKAAHDLLRYDAGIKHPGADVVIVSRERVHTLENALAAVATPAQVEPAITPEMLRAGIGVAETHFLQAHGAWRDLVVAVYRAMYLSRPSPSGEAEVALSRKDVAENSGGRG